MVRAISVAFGLGFGDQAQQVDHPGLGDHLDVQELSPLVFTKPPFTFAVIVASFAREVAEAMPATWISLVTLRTFGTSAASLLASARVAWSQASPVSSTCG